MTAPVLFEVRDVVRGFTQPRTRLLQPGRRVDVLAGVSFDVLEAESLGIVGESGAGKTTLLRLLLGLEPPDSGSITYHGGDVRREVQVVFQDPAGALDPRMTVRDAILEPVRVMGIPVEPEARVSELLESVGLSRAAARRYPHEFSGGQRQRIAIARALAPRPRVLLADEPVSALDVSVRAQILNLLKDLRESYRLTLVLVSHDLSVVRHMCDRVLVMRAGRVVEVAATRSLFEAPADPYTRSLLDSIPRLRPARGAGS